MGFQCEVCKKPAHQKCSGCWAVHYCSAVHQKEHWKCHKTNCSYFVIRDDPEYGKGFYASRDIKAGTIIHEEKPFVFMPFWPSYKFGGVPSCVACGLVKKPGHPPLLEKCSRCKWPYCSSECLQIHADMECKTLVAKQLIFPPESKIYTVDFSDLLVLIRTAVAKKKHPEAFQGIMQLRSKSDGPVEADYTHADLAIEQTLGRLSVFFKADDLKISQGELKKLLKILRLNSYSTIGRTDWGKPFSPTPAAEYLYPKASQIQHSCVPNCSWVISWKPDFEIRVRTAVPVKKGEPLRVSYYMTGAVKSRMDRVTTIRMQLGQWCKCWRCNDPTESGIFESAVVCSSRSCKKNKGSIGYMLPGDPLSLYFNGPWKCNLCNIKKANEIVTCEQKKIGESISEKERDLEAIGDLRALITFCKKVIHENSGKTVHHNHWIIQDATRIIMKNLPHCSEGSMDLQTSQYYVKNGQYLLAIQDVVSPGISYHRAVLQKQIASALQDQVTELCSQKKFDEALRNLDQCLKLQAEALTYFKDELPKDPYEISDANVLRIAMKCAAECRVGISSKVDDEFRCVVCGKEAYQNCPQCYLVTYCSTDHRQKHWKSHSKSCSCFVIKEGSGDGKGFFASRNIEAGTVILEETPVVSGPSWDILDFGVASFCVTCGVEMEIAEVASPKRQCSKCNWPSCSLSCHVIHNENECKIFELAGHKLNFPPKGYFVPKEIRDLVLLIRTTILKKKNPGIYQQILELRSESVEPNHNDRNLEAALHLLRPIVNSNGANIDQEEFKKLYKILRMNCFSDIIYIRINKTTGRRISGSEYLSIKATKMEQSCAPNCSWEITESPNFNIRIRATKAVKEGEALTVNYNVRGNQQGTKERQETIRRKRGTSCTCERCKDPSELGTYMSAITCKICTDTDTIGTSDEFSYFLPEDPLDLTESAKWRCNRCGLVKLSSVILPPVEQIQNLISNKAKECFSHFKTSTMLNYCKTIIKKYSGKSLHPNHWVLQNATRLIFEHLPVQCGGSMDLETSQYYVKCGLYLLSIQDIVSPGLTLSRAVLQKRIGPALHNQNNELHSQKRHKEAWENLQNCLKLLTEAFNFYQCAEGQGGQHMTELKAEIDRVSAASNKALSSLLETNGNILQKLAITD